MGSIKIVFGQDERGGLWNGRFCEADYFIKYDYWAGGFREFTGKVKNYAKGEAKSQNCSGKAGDVKLLLAACDCAAACIMSPNFKEMAGSTPIQPFVVRGCEDMRSFLLKLGKNYDLIRAKVIMRRKGEKEKVVPVF